MSSRSYLSIGDVLTLLRQEFPDVTISKIRFLESQGLVDPERTPSGYRKFYDHDVERLRWILRQQREHFLPLKVIKDRLDDEPGTPDSPAPAAAGPAEPVPPAAAEVAERRSSAAHGGHHADEPVLVGQRVSSDAAAKGDPLDPGGGTGDQVDRRTEIARHRILAQHRPRVVRIPNCHPGGSASTLAAVAAAAPSNPSRGPRRRSCSCPGAGHRGRRPGEPTAKSDPRPPAAASARPRRARTTPGDHDDTASPGRQTGAAPAPAPEAKAPASGGNRPAGPAGGDGVSMSADELAASSGLEVSVILELQEYGLLNPMVVAGLEYFDEDALAVATAAARFAQFGIEPRHLRLYKNAADREAGFVEQIVLPLVRQRNPEARARAHETVDELSLLGQQLRARAAPQRPCRPSERLTGG